MKRRYFIPLLIFTGLIGLCSAFFFGPRTAAASLPPDFLELKNTNDNFCQAMAVFNDVNLGIVNGYDGVIDKISLYFERHNYQLTDNLALTLCAYSSSDDALYGDGTCADNSGFQELTTIYNNPIGEQAMSWKELVLDSNFTFNPAYYYSLVASFNAYPCYGVNTSYGDWGRATSGTASSFMVQWGALITDEIDWSNVSVSNYAATIPWTYTLDSATQFLGYYTIQEDFEIYKCQSSASSTCQTQFFLGGWQTEKLNVSSGSATTTFNLPNGYYQIKNFQVGYDTDSDGSADSFIMITVPSNVFQINYSPFDIPTISIPTSTLIATTTPFQITCDPDDPWYAYSFCKLMVWLFIPDDDVLNQFTVLSAQISNKAPFGYINQISNALNNLSSTTPAFIIDIDNDNPVKTTFFNPVRTGFIFILWFSLTFWIFHRFRHFNFTSP